MKWMPETAARSAIEGASGRLRDEARVVIDGLLGGYLAGVVGAAQAPLDELIHPEKCW
jgi:hypothetical protein